MKHTNVVAACGLLILSALGTTVLAQSTSRVTEHINTTQNFAKNDSDHALYLSDGTNLFISDDFVTKTSATGQSVLFSKTYSLNGSVFSGFEAVEVQGTIVMIEPRGTFCRVIATDLQGNIQWAKRFSTAFSELCESHNGNVLLAGYFKDGTRAIFETVEIDLGGSVLQRRRNEIQGVQPTTSALFLNDIIRTGQGYFAAVSSNDFESFTISIDQGQNLIAAMRPMIFNFPMFFGDDLEIRSLQKAKNGDMYFMGEVRDSNSGDDHFICGKIDFNHNILQNRILNPIDNPTWSPELSISDNTARITETPNKVPYHSGNVTIIPNNEAVTFCAKLTYNFLTTGRQRRVALFQYDENFNSFNHSMVIEFPKEIASPGIIERTNRIELFSDQFATPDSYQYKLTEDFTGCFISQLNVDEWSVFTFPIPLTIAGSEQEFSVEDQDFNDTDQSNNSNEVCSMTFEKSAGLEAHSSAEVEIYPNPSNGTIHVTGLDETAELELYTITGQRVVLNPAFSNGEFEITDLKPGVFVLRMVEGEKLTQKRFVVK